MIIRYIIKKILTGDYILYISSMTGFARKNSSYSAGKIEYSWIWEIKSVNGKALDVKAKLPANLEGLSLLLKNAAGEVLHRGSISAFLELSAAGSEQNIRINKDLMRELAAAAADLYEESEGRLEKPSASDILGIKGVVEIEEYLPDEEEQEKLQQALLQSFTETCRDLQTNREAEGNRIKNVLSGILRQIRENVLKAEEIASGLPDVLKQKLKEQISLLLEPSEGISEDRLAQEVVLLVNRSDVREELDRLKAHIRAAEEMLEQGGVVGRRLDFLCQELNREANTLCSKSADTGLTNLGMDLKVLIEQFREQVQNIE